MAGHFDGSTVLFHDAPRPEETATEQDEEMLIRRLPKPSASVVCAIPVTLRLMSGNPRALVRQLDVSGATLQVEHALPDDATAWLPLPLPGGLQAVPCRVVAASRAAPGAPWEVELKFQISEPSIRAGLAGLVRALRNKLRQTPSRR